MLEVPIFHVNGAYPEQVVYATPSHGYRTASTDVVIDMVCFRRYGHNESDEPGFTQPLMYQKIESASRRAAALFEQRWPAASSPKRCRRDHRPQERRAGRRAAPGPHQEASAAPVESG